LDRYANHDFDGSDWTQAYEGILLIRLFHAIPFNWQVTIMAESSDVGSALAGCCDQDWWEIDPEVYTYMPQWQTMIKMVKSKGITMICGPFDENVDANFMKMRIVAIWEAQETMERGISERNNPNAFLA
jgi:hypothetical protein